MMVGGVKKAELMWSCWPRFPSIYNFNQQTFIIYYEQRNNKTKIVTGNISFKMKNISHQKKCFSVQAEKKDNHGQPYQSNLTLRT